jgi:hypothetical protein
MAIIESAAVIQMLFTVIWLNYTIGKSSDRSAFKSFHAPVKIEQHLYMCVLSILMPGYSRAAQNTRFARGSGRTMQTEYS